MNNFALNFVQILVVVLNMAILGRAILSWVAPNNTGPLSAALYQITEPILAPIRKIMPSTGMFDLSPMIAVFMLDMVIFPLIKSLLA